MIKRKEKIYLYISRGIDPVECQAMRNVCEAFIFDYPNVELTIYYYEDKTELFGDHRIPYGRYPFLVLIKGSHVLRHDGLVGPEFLMSFFGYKLIKK